MLSPSIIAQPLNDSQWQSPAIHRSISPERHDIVIFIHSIRFVNNIFSFLSGLLDTLLTSIHRSLPFGLFCHLFPCFGILIPCQSPHLAPGNNLSDSPACCLALKARSSSSRSAFSFFGAFRGLTLPPMNFGVSFHDAS